MFLVEKNSHKSGYEMCIILGRVPKFLRLVTSDVNWRDWRRFEAIRLAKKALEAAIVMLSTAKDVKIWEIIRFRQPVTSRIVRCEPWTTAMDEKKDRNSSIL